MNFLQDSSPLHTILFICFLTACLLVVKRRDATSEILTASPLAITSRMLADVILSIGLQFFSYKMVKSGITKPLTGIIAHRYLLEKIKPSSEGFLRLLGSCYRDQSPLGVAPQRCPYAPLVLQIYIFI